ncbi:MAG: hypothetical protein IE916_08625, partial [Epsilonproteobacteria bacterium]|nr:hypothetical protein [Campylobacterota bacterium]
MQEALRLSRERDLAKEHYWQLLLHMNNGVSEIDDKRFSSHPMAIRMQPPSLKRLFSDSTKTRRTTTPL